jgi:tetratricopeptide (TPR) repeat protein
MLLPASGFFNVLFMFYSFVQNHFVYFASLPVVALIGFALDRAAGRLPLPHARIAVAALVLAPLAALTWSESETFANEEVLWRASVERNPRAWMALTNLGGLLVERGEFESAEHYLREVIAVNPVDYWAHNNLGIAMARRGRFEEAIPHYKAAIDAMRDNPVAWTNLGMALSRLGRPAAAVHAWRTALALDPSYHPAQEALLSWQRGERP